MLSSFGNVKKNPNYVSFRNIAPSIFQVVKVNISAVLIGTRGSQALSMLSRDLKPKEKMVMDLTAAVTDSTSPLAVSNSFHNRVYCEGYCASTHTHRGNIQCLLRTSNREQISISFQISKFCPSSQSRRFPKWTSVISSWPFIQKQCFSASGRDSNIFSPTG